MATEVKIVFTADLKPYVEGLKSMLSMTATTGEQLKPLLNVDITSPDVSGLEAQLKSVVDKTDAYIKSLGEAGSANEVLGGKEEEHAEVTERAGHAVERKSVSLNKMKRNALESFGAIAFLATGIVELSSKASGGSKDIDKLNRGMSEGISAGFGLAGTLSVLGLATGGVAVAIGAAVAVGLSLLKFFDDAEERQKRMATAMEMFSRSLKGASVKDLDEYRQNLIEAIKVSDEYIDSLERSRAALAKNDFQGRAVLSSMKDQEKVKRDLLVGEREQLDRELNAREKTAAEVRDFIRQAETASTVDQFEQRRRSADEILRKELEEYKGHVSARAAARTKHAAEMKRIAQEEAQFNQQIADQKFEAELAGIAAHGLERGALQERTDLEILSARLNHYRQELNQILAVETELSPQQRLRKQQLETLLTQIQLQESEKRIALDRHERNVRMQFYDLLIREEIAKARTRGVLLKQLEEQTAEDVLDVRRRAAQAELRQLKGEETAAIASGREFDEEKKKRIRELEVSLTEITADGVEARKRTIEAERDAWEEHHQYIVGPLLAGYDAFFDSLVNQSRSVSQQMIDDQIRQSEFSARQREVDFELFLIDQQDRRDILLAQFQNGEISQREYNLRLQQMDLEKQQREQDNRDATAQAEEELLAMRQQYDEERKSSMERALEAMKNTTINVIGDMLREEIRKGVVSLLAHQTVEQAKVTATVSSQTAQTAATETGVFTRLGLLGLEIVESLASAAASMVKAAASAVEWQIATFGPFAIFTISASLAALVGAFTAIKSAFGFEKGGQIEKGQMGFFEGRDVEIIAPKKDFKEVFRQDLMPELLNIIAQGNAPQILLPSVRREVLTAAAAQASGFGGSSISVSDDRMMEVVERFERAIDRFEAKEFELVGDMIVTASDQAREKRRRTGNS